MNAIYPGKHTTVMRTAINWFNNLGLAICSSLVLVPGTQALLR